MPATCIPAFLNVSPSLCTQSTVIKFNCDPLSHNARACPDIFMFLFINRTRMVANNESASLIDIYATIAFPFSSRPFERVGLIVDRSDSAIALVLEPVTSEDSTFCWHQLFLANGFLSPRPRLFFDVRAVLAFAITMNLGHKTRL